MQQATTRTRRHLVHHKTDTDTVDETLSTGADPWVSRNLNFSSLNNQTRSFGCIPTGAYIALSHKIMYLIYCLTSVIGHEVVFFSFNNMSVLEFGFSLRMRIKNNK